MDCQRMPLDESTIRPSSTDSTLSRRKFLAGAGVSVALATATVRAAGQVVSNNRPPNVLLLMTDEHSPHALGCDGNDLIQTPALDSLADQGLLFRSAYCQNPICVPSRASLLTGKMPSRLDVFGNDGGLTEKVTMATVFGEAGYTTAWMGKEHWGGDSGFGDSNVSVVADQKKRCRVAKEFRKEIGRLPHDAAVSPHPVEGDDDTVTTDHALKFLDTNQDKPFFLGVSYRKPHFPFEVQQKYLDMYLGRTDAPRVTQAMLDDLCVASKKERATYRFAELTDSQIKYARAMYFGMITYIDDQIARVLNRLDQLGLRENTIILYTSDHGDLAGEHGLWYKNSFYEGSASIPFIWSFPKRLPKQKQIDAHVMNMDIFPTLCELCELPEPDGLDGSSLVSLMRGDEEGEDRIALSENYRGGVAGRMIRLGPWKYCWYSEGNAQLYNLKEDPDEERNLIAVSRHADLVAELKARVLDGYVERPKK